MKFLLRRPAALAATVALLALPLESALVQRPAFAAVVLPHIVSHTSPAEAPNQGALASYIATRYDKPLAYAGDIVRTTVEEAKRLALPPGLLLGIMAKESGFDSSAKSSYGARGLMQVVPRFHMGRLRKNETAASFRDPRTNIRIGAHILAEYLATHKSLDKALQKYSGASRDYTRQIRSNWLTFEKVGHLSAPPSPPARSA